MKFTCVGTHLYEAFTAVRRITNSTNIVERKFVLHAVDNKLYIWSQGGSVISCAIVDAQVDEPGYVTLGVESFNIFQLIEEVEVKALKTTLKLSGPVDGKIPTLEKYDLALIEKLLPTDGIFLDAKNVKKIKWAADKVADNLRGMVVKDGLVVCSDGFQFAFFKTDIDDSTNIPLILFNDLPTGDLAIVVEEDTVWSIVKTNTFKMYSQSGKVKMNEAIVSIAKQYHTSPVFCTANKTDLRKALAAVTALSLEPRVLLEYSPSILSLKTIDGQGLLGTPVSAGGEAFSAITSTTFLSNALHEMGDIITISVFDNLINLSDENIFVTLPKYKGV